MLALALTLTLTAPAQAPVEVVLGGFRTVGLSDDETSTYRGRLDEEMAGMGVQMNEPDTPLDVSCYDDLDCLTSNASKGKGMIDVELVRVGPFMQVKFRMWDGEGELRIDEDGMEDAEEFASGGRVTPAVFGETVGASGVPLSGDDPEEESDLDDGTITEEIAPPPAEEPGTPEDMPLLGYAGIGVAVVGAAVLVGGSLLALNEATVLGDANSPGTDKERARVVGPVSLVAAGVGAVVVGGGGALATIGFSGM
jgi:hypothetical protein